jgi:hypothetical protein
MTFKVPVPNELPRAVRLAVQAVKDYVDVRNLRCVRLTTAERDALSAEAGMIVFNTTVSKHQGYDGTTWQNFY